jgi:hypothetical protein
MDSEDELTALGMEQHFKKSHCQSHLSFSLCYYVCPFPRFSRFCLNGSNSVWDISGPHKGTLKTMLGNFKMFDTFSAVKYVVSISSCFQAYAIFQTLTPLCACKWNSSLKSTTFPILLSSPSNCQSKQMKFSTYCKSHSQFYDHSYSNRKPLWRSTSNL